MTSLVLPLICNPRRGCFFWSDNFCVLLLHFPVLLIDLNDESSSPVSLLELHKDESNCLSSCVEFLDSIPCACGLSIFSTEENILLPRLLGLKNFYISFKIEICLIRHTVFALHVSNVVSHLNLIHLSCIWRFTCTPAFAPNRHHHLSSRVVGVAFSLVLVLCVSGLNLHFFFSCWTTPCSEMTALRHLKYGI